MDILFPRFVASTSSSQSTALIRDILIAILEDDDSYATWSSGSNAYYDRVAKKIEADDPSLVSNIKSIANVIRARYRTHIEHELNVHDVPLHRATELSVETALDDACCICLQPLKSFRKVVRLRPRDSQEMCGHFLHEECMNKLKPSSETGSFSCPMCRANLGRAPISTWYDTERAIPKF